MTLHVGNRDNDEHISKRRLISLADRIEPSRMPMSFRNPSDRTTHVLRPTQWGSWPPEGTWPVGHLVVASTRYRWPSQNGRMEGDLQPAGVNMCGKKRDLTGGWNGAYRARHGQNRMKRMDRWRQKGWRGNGRQTGTEGETCRAHRWRSRVKRKDGRRQTAWPGDERQTWTGGGAGSMG